MKLFFKEEEGKRKEKKSHLSSLITHHFLPFTFYFLFIIFYSLTLAQPPSALFNIPWNERSIFEQGLTTQSQEILEHLQDAPVYHLEWILSNDLMHLDGKAEVLVTHTGEQAWPDVVFRLYPNALGSTMTVSEVQANGLAVTPKLEAENTTVRIPLPQVLEATQQILISMTYTLDISPEIEAYGRLARFEKVLSLAHAYPTLSILENGQWETEIPPPLGDPLVANEAFFLAQVTAPQDYDLITTGQEIQKTIQGTQQTVEYVAGPARDFYLAAAKDYVVAESNFGETRVRSFVPKTLSFRLQSSLHTAKQSLEFFSGYYPYPYREFDVVAVPVQAGGVEYPGIVNITNGLYANPFSRLNAVITHEVGHQWAFSLVGNDQIENPWLDESLTQYLTLRYQETHENRSSIGYLRYWQQLWETSTNPELVIGLPVESYDESTYGEIVYGKGLFFFEELAKTIGQETLDEGLRVYFQTYAWQFAEPQDLQNSLETACICDLDALFELWVSGLE